MSGERIALLGPNGCGKSTLLKTLARLIKPITGSIEIEGLKLTSMSFADIARRIAVIPQEEIPPFGFTVREFVTMGRLPFGNGIWDSRDDARMAEAAMQVAECDHLADRNVMDLSGGERQRTLLARAIAQGSKIWLMDEPTAHLDVAHQLQVARLVKGRSSEETVVAAIHDLNQATLMADRAIVIHEGKIAVDGPIEEVLRGPEIEDVFQVRFDRMKAPSGRTILAPRA